MESKANYALIGVFVLIAFFGAMAFFAYVANKQFDEEYDNYIVVYTVPPRGISVGSEVRYNGLKMGEVTETRLDPTDPNRVLVHIQVLSDTPVLKESYGQNEPLGLTGLSYIQLYPGDSAEPASVAMGRQFARIEGRGSQLDTLLGGSESVIENVNFALVRAIEVLGPEATEDFHGILSNINDITATINGSDISGDRVEQFLSAIEQAANDISIAALAVDQTAQDVSGLITSEELNAILINANQTVLAANATLAEFEELANDSSAVTDEALFAIEQFSATGLQELSLALAELKMLMESLHRVSQDIERGPASFIVGTEKQTTELPQ